MKTFEVGQGAGLFGPQRPPEFFRDNRTVNLGERAGLLPRLGGVLGQGPRVFGQPRQSDGGGVRAVGGVFALAIG